MGLFDGSIDHAAEKLRPILDDAEARLTSAIQCGLDRLSGAKITITIELPPARPLSVGNGTGT